MWLLFHTVLPRAEQEEGQGHEHHGPGRTEPGGPADVVLHVAQGDDGDDVARGHGEVEPVEVGAPGRDAARSARGELVGSEGLRAWLVEALRQRHHVDCAVEERCADGGRRRTAGGR